MRSWLQHLSCAAVTLIGTTLPLSAQTDYATPYAFTTIAGVASIGRNDGPGNTARFNRPGGLTIDAAGNLFVADTGNHAIRKITPAGVVSTFVGKSGFPGAVEGSGTDARFWFPNGIATDRAGNLFVADSSNNRIRKITSAGTVSTLAGGALMQYDANGDGAGSEAVFHHPEGVAVDPAGNVLVADTNASTIRRVTPAGVVSTFQPVFSPDPAATNNFWNTRFYYPESLAVDAQGNVYVPSTVLGGIHKMSPDGSVALFAGDPRPGVPTYADGTGTAAHFFRPRGIAVDSSGKAFVADQIFQTIRQILPDRTVSTLAGAANQTGDTDGLAAVARFFVPSGIAVDASGNLFISESDNNLIRRLTPEGIVSTVAGLSYFESAGTADGPGTTARFFQPHGIAAGPGGVLYVADRINHTIRKILATGEVSTFAGEPGVSGYADGDGRLARFNSPFHLATDGAGNVYVSDYGNNVIRKITPGGTVSTVAGKYNVFALTDGPLATATFYGISGIAVDNAGNLFVADGAYAPTAVLHKVGIDGQISTVAALYTRPPDEDGRLEPSSYYSGIALDTAGNVYSSNYATPGFLKISPTGTLTQIPLTFTPNAFAFDRSGNLFATGGLYVAMIRPDGSATWIAGGTEGSADGVGLDAQFVRPVAITVDASGNVYVSDSSEFANNIRKGRLAGAPVISQQPQSMSLTAGSSGTLSVTAAAAPDPTYQWYFKDTALSGATASSYTLSNIQTSAAGDYTVVVSNSLGSVTSAKATVTVTSTTPPTPPGNSGGGGTNGAPFVLALATLVLSRRASGILRRE